MDMLDIMKLVAINAVEGRDPVKFVFGKVTSTAPLKILVDQKIEVGAPFLRLARSVTDHEIQMEVNHVTEKMSGGAKDPSFTSHLHQYKGVKTFKVLNALKEGEMVIIAVAQGGQHYIVLDRVGEG